MEKCRIFDKLCADVIFHSDEKIMKWNNPGVDPQKLSGYLREPGLTSAVPKKIRLQQKWHKMTISGISNQIFNIVSHF